MRTDDLKDPPPFPWICAVTTKSYIAKKRENVKKVVMSLIEATHFFKTNKEQAKKIMGKYFPTANSAYLEDNYTTTIKILERVCPLCNAPWHGNSHRRRSQDESWNQSHG